MSGKGSVLQSTGKGISLQSTGKGISFGRMAAECQGKAVFFTELSSNCPLTNCSQSHSSAALATAEFRDANPIISIVDTHGKRPRPFARPVLVKHRSIRRCRAQLTDRVRHGIRADVPHTQRDVPHLVCDLDAVLDAADADDLAQDFEVPERPTIPYESAESIQKRGKRMIHRIEGFFLPVEIVLAAQVFIRLGRAEADDVVADAVGEARVAAAVNTERGVSH